MTAPTRPTHCRTVTEVNGWRLKHYEISVDPTIPITDAVRTAALQAVDRLVAAPDSDSASGLGFSVLHHGTQGVWLMIDRWHGDIVHHDLHHATLADPTAFEPVAPKGPTMCVHEIEVVHHESRAYHSHVLAPPTPDPDAYLADTVDNRTHIEHRTLLEAFEQAWNRADVDSLMTLMTDAPTYHASTGPEPGATHIGADDVRAGFERVIRAEGAACPSDLQKPSTMLIAGDQAVTSWSYTEPDPGGRPCRIDGIDVWTFDNGRIATKDAYRKAFPHPGSGA